MVSERSKTEWIIRRSSLSMSEEASARSTSSRSSVSVENGPSVKPLPGVIALPSRISTRGTGPRTRVTHVSGPAENRATDSECWRPRVRGATPMTTKDSTSITATVTMTVTAHDSWKRSRTSRVASTIAVTSQARRSSSAVLR